MLLYLKMINLKNKQILNKNYKNIELWIMPIFSLFIESVKQGLFFKFFFNKNLRKLYWNSVFKIFALRIL